MKYFVLITLLTLATHPASAGEMRFEDLPSTIKKAFRKAHPNARAIEVEREREYGEALYEIEFKENSRKDKALYHVEDHSFFGYERKLPPQLPEVVWKAIRQRFPRASVKEAEVVVDAQNRPLAYEVELENDDREWKAYFNSDGSFIETRKDCYDSIRSANRPFPPPRRNFRDTSFDKPVETAVKSPLTK